MIAPNDSIDSQSTDAPLPNSKKIYVSGKIHSDVCVPFREIALAPTKSISGEIEVNEPFGVWHSSETSARQRWPSCHAALVRAAGNHHIGNGIHRNKGAGGKRRTPNAERPMSK